MHFSIPSTQEFGSDGSGSSYTGFNIHINGSFHCCLRYKQLHSLQEQLKRSLPSIALPSFPPKKLLSLTPNQIEQRRLSLERYIQLVGQDPVLCRSELLRAFLLNAQQESSFTECSEVTLDVYLMNGYRISASVYTTDCTGKVLEKACALIDLPKDRACYFALYLMRKEASGALTIVKRLMEFEAPYISAKRWDDCKLVLRTGYWDACYDLELMRDRIALNLLYLQAMSDVERGWIVTTRDQSEQLTNMQARGSKSEYLDVVRKLPLYGCLQFPRACVDYPEPNTVATVVLGNKELNLLTYVGKEMQETKFKVTRIRCWRVTPIHINEDNQSSTGGGYGRQQQSSSHASSQQKSSSSSTISLELSFEYLMAKNQLKWITIYSEQSMLMSVCLQSIVDELLNQKNGSDPAHLQNPQHVEYAPLSYIRRDGSNHCITDSSSTDTLCNLVNNDSSSNNGTSTQQHSTNNGSSFIRRKLKEFNTTVRFKNGKDSVQNEAFEWIGDDDL
uniref:PX domain-containing protein n=1 Tax=Anopheles coluzzii TaxID=1518534 RepID=A0A6E8W553_ANOCL|nr:sorting nexin-17 [Anopheles coluzzii]XP_040235780.2 sorting nexin-17 [Anopheles coluzzii]